ncbi:hypothetical protein KIPB_016956, partial [Kipferlia bialata]|eukprot:g16956.t1
MFADEIRRTANLGSSQNAVISTYMASCKQYDVVPSSSIVEQLQDVGCSSLKCAGTQL